MTGSYEANGKLISDGVVSEPEDTELGSGRFFLSVLGKGQTCVLVAVEGFFFLTIELFRCTYELKSMRSRPCPIHATYTFAIRLLLVASTVVGV